MVTGYLAGIDQTRRRHKNARQVMQSHVKLWSFSGHRADWQSAAFGFCDCRINCLLQRRSRVEMNGFQP